MTLNASGETRVLRQVLAEEAGAGSDRHLDPGRLRRYHAGELADDEEDRAREHLVACRDCARALIDLDDLAGAVAAPVAEAPDLSTHAGYRAFRAAIQPPLSDAADARRRVARALAACLVLVAGAQLAWVAHLRQINQALRGRLAELSRPRVNPKSLVIAATMRDESADAPRVLSAADPLLLVEIVPDPLAAATRYRVEILDRHDEVIWAGEGVELDGAVLRVLLPRALFDDGLYRFRATAGDRGASPPALDRKVRLRFR